MNQDLDITNFTAGEFSPRMVGRFDEAKYFNACKTLRNMVVLPQGGATARPGTMMVNPTGDQTYGERLIAFIFSTLQAYIIGFGNLYCRFYADDAVVVSGGVPVQLVTPYAAAELQAIGYVQSFDVLYVLHNNHPPQQLTRTGAVAFSIAASVFRDGPYDGVNTTATTLTPSAFSGSITLTASALAGINNGAGFGAGDIGRFIRIKLLALWAWTTITAVNSSLQVTVTVNPQVDNGAWGALDGAAWQPSFAYIDGAVVTGPGSGPTFYAYRCTVAGTSAPSGGPTSTATPPFTDGTVTWQLLTIPLPSNTADWCLSKWCPGNGYPALGTFWQNRLALMNTTEAPNIIELSVTGDFTNFAPTQADGSVTDINACSWSISDDEVNAIHWVSPAGSAQAMQLGIGTSAGEEILQAATTSAALTPANVQAYRETKLGGAAYVRPARIAKSVLFANRTGRKLHEWTFTWQVNGYVGPDLTVLAEHITRPVPAEPDALGIVQMAYQQNPHSVLWAIRSDGGLIGLTYLRDQDIVAWHQHQLGGQYYGGPPRVESLAVIPSPQGGYDELWLEVLRTINGVPTRTVELMSPYFEGVSPDMAWFMDCGLRNVLAYPAATVTVGGLIGSTDPDKPRTWSGNNGTLFASAAVFSSASVGSIIRLNGGKVVVTTLITAELVWVQVLEPLTSLAPAAANTWSLGALVSSVSGLAYLIGETVTLLGDGQVNPQVLVTADSVTLASPASLVTVGLPYIPALVTMPYEPARAAAASAHGKIKRINTMWLRFFETLGGTFGVRQVDPLTFVETVKTEQIETKLAWYPMGQGSPLFTGVRRLPALGGYDREQQLMIVQTDPLPMTVLAMSCNAAVEEVQ